MTYIPSLDPVLPSPSHLHLKVKNTSAIALRAAYLHGPYTLYAACYPSTFDPNQGDKSSRTHGVPDFEPNLKAGGSWLSQLTVPENIRETADKANVKRTLDGRVPSCTWIIEVSSQIIFSTSATVHFELLVARDEKSIESRFSAIPAHTGVTPGQLQDHERKKRENNDSSSSFVDGVYSKAVELVVESTEKLWNKPYLPDWNDEGKDRGRAAQASGDRGMGNSHGGIRTGRESSDSSARNKQKKIHLVVLTHGLHSNLGADMLYIKESIDATARQARLDARKRKWRHGSVHRPKEAPQDYNSLEAGLADQRESTPAGLLSGGTSELVCDDEDVDEDEEQVIVRGFSGNTVRTERGIQYLGKRLAKYVLSMTYPDQPYSPPKKSKKKSQTKTHLQQQVADMQGLDATTDTQGGQNFPSSNLAYKITSISFIAHSLGGLTQTYAIAYIQKYSPTFFEIIKPINFVSLATPFLGLSNENPIYVKFALDFGLVGRTGQDLGLAWRAPAMVRSGWTAMVGGIGTESQRVLRQTNPSSKPLLRILPAGPAHQVLKLFRNRTVYSNVVNDGIVPLRTSCLLFLDWSGLGRVEKARRENGIVGTMAGWGWAELTGAKSSARSQLHDHRGTEFQYRLEKSDEDETDYVTNHIDQGEVPQPSESAAEDKMGMEGNGLPELHQPSDTHSEESQDAKADASPAKSSSSTLAPSAFGSLLQFLRPGQQKSRRRSPKRSKIYSRSQTLSFDSIDGGSYSSESVSEVDSLTTSPPQLPKNESTYDDSDVPFDPPRTSIFESAGDILNPPLPSQEFILHPASRPRTIFHDRIYHPEDIPPPRIQKRSGLKRSFSSEPKTPASNTNSSSHQETKGSNSGMKVEEKIARAYHRDLSWRKVLVRLEPDAHNNICVRRMFSNAYGWPVVQHLVDTHFADSWTACTADSKEPNHERAKPLEEGAGLYGEEVQMQPAPTEFKRTDSEVRESKDHLSSLTSLDKMSMSSTTGRPRLTHHDSAQWDDRFLEESEDDSDFEDAGFRRSLEIPTSGLTTDEDAEKHAPISNIPNTLPSSSSSKMGEQKTPADVIQQKLDAGDLVAEPEPTEQNKSESIVIRGRTTSLGLGKSVEEQLGRIAGVEKQSLNKEEVKGSDLE